MDMTDAQNAAQPQGGIQIEPPWTWKIRMYLFVGILIAFVVWYFFLDSPSPHAFVGFHPVSLARQCDLIRVASGGAKKNGSAKTSISDVIQQLPVTIVSQPCFKKDSNNNYESCLPEVSDWNQWPVVIEATSGGKPYLKSEGRLDLYVQDVYTDANGVKKSIKISKKNDSPEWDSLFVETGDDQGATKIKINNFTCSSLPTPSDSSYFGNKFESMLKDLLGSILVNTGPTVPAADNVDLVVDLEPNSTSLSAKIEKIQFGSKAKDKVPDLSSGTYARMLAGLGKNKSDDAIVAWISGCDPNLSSTTEQPKPITSDNVSISGFPFDGEIPKALLDNYSDTLTLVWFDQKNKLQNGDCRFCVELKYESDTWSRKVTAKFRLITGKGTPIVPTPDSEALLYHRWRLGFCNSTATAAQVADRFFPLYEQVYKSQYNLKDGPKFKSPSQEEINRVKRWIEAVIQDQIYFKSHMEGSPEFDPLNHEAYPPIDKSIEWARRIHGSDWWGLIQVSIAVCFFYPLVCLAWLKEFSLFEKSLKGDAFTQRVRFSTRTMPLLGFLGTVVGISSSLAGAGGVLSEKLIDRQAVLSNMTQNLATAFDTTFVGICGSIALLCAEKFLRGKVED